MPMIGTIYQLAYMVEDLEPACQTFSAATGTGPFFLLPHVQFLEPMFQGSHLDVDISIALGFSGDTMIELIQAHRPPCGVYPDVAGVGRPVFHHVARLTRQIDIDLMQLAGLGCPVSFTGMFYPNTRFAYVDTRAMVGGYSEFIDYTPGIAGMIEVMQMATSGWDGRDPLRSF